MRVTHEERIISAYLARLQRVSTYAKKQDVSPVEAYRRIDSGKVQSVKIDGVAFVVLPAAHPAPPATPAEGR